MVTIHLRQWHTARSVKRRSMTKREKLIWCIFGAILGVLFLLSFTDLIIKEKKAEIYPISVVLDSTTDECYANFKKGGRAGSQRL